MRSKPLSVSELRRKARSLRLLAEAAESAFNYSKADRLLDAAMVYESASDSLTALTATASAYRPSPSLNL